MQTEMLFDDPTIKTLVKTKYTEVKHVNLEECIETLKTHLSTENVNFEEKSDRIIIKRRGQTTLAKVKNAMQKLSADYGNLNYMFSIVTTDKTVVIKERRQ